MNRKKLLIIFISLIYFASSVYLAFIHRFSLNPDAIAYINVAKNYAEMNLPDAINPYWSPLISWLMAPMIHIKIQGEIAFYLLNILSGYLILWVLNDFIKKLEFSKITRYFLLITCVFFVLSKAISTLTPDLLASGLLILYCSILFDKNYTKHPKGILCGTIGAIAYFAKAYSLPFFLLHFTLINLLYLFCSKPSTKKLLAKNMFIGIITFTFISGIWVFALSFHQGSFTIGSSGSYNFKIGIKQEHPILNAGLMKPPVKNSTSIWYDPTISLEYQKNDFSKLKKPVHFLARFFKNTRDLHLAYSNFFMAYWLTILICTTFLCYLISRKKMSPIEALPFMLITFLIYPSGYLFIHVLDRFLFLNFFLILFMSAYLIEQISIKKIYLKTFLLVVIFGTIAFQFFENYSKPDDKMYKIALILQQNHISGNIASNFAWNNSYYLAYKTNNKYFGMTSYDDFPEKLDLKLQNNNIDYYLAWLSSEKEKLIEQKERQVLSYLDSKYEKYTIKGNLPILYIYDLRKKSKALIVKK